MPQFWLVQSAAEVGERTLRKPTFQLRICKPRRVEGGPEQEADYPQEQVIKRIPAQNHYPSDRDAKNTWRKHISSLKV